MRPLSWPYGLRCSVCSSGKHPWLLALSPPPPPSLMAICCSWCRFLDSHHCPFYNSSLTCWSPPLVCKSSDSESPMPSGASGIELALGKHLPGEFLMHWGSQIPQNTNTVWIGLRTPYTLRGWVAFEDPKSLRWSRLHLSIFTILKWEWGKF